MTDIFAPVDDTDGIASGMADDEHPAEPTIDPPTEPVE